MDIMRTYKCFSNSYAEILRLKDLYGYRYFLPQKDCKAKILWYDDKRKTVFSLFKRKKIIIPNLKSGDDP